MNAALTRQVRSMARALMCTTAALWSAIRRSATNAIEKSRSGFAPATAIMSYLNVVLFQGMVASYSRFQLEIDS
jgi:transcriptional regulator